MLHDYICNFFRHSFILEMQKKSYSCGKNVFLVTGKLGRMAGIGTGRGPLYMDIPVEPRDALQKLYILWSKFYLKSRF